MTAPSTVALVADRLIDGTGRDPVEAAVVVWEGDRLVAAGSRSAVKVPEGARVIEGDDLTVLPGLMDMHVHLAMQTGMNLLRMMMTPRSFTMLHGVPHCDATLQAGFTTVRDAGGTPVGVKMAVENGFFPGPRMHLSVAILSQTGGHADPYMPCGCEMAIDGTLDIPFGRVDGVDEMRRRVREVLRAGADNVKLCTSGGVLSPGDLPDTPQFTVEEIATAVYEAGVHHKHVLAHAMSAQGIKNALRGGVLSIEHGCLLDEEGVALMREKHAYLVPTLVAPRDVAAIAATNPEAIPAEMVDKARRVAAVHMENFRAAVAGGVQVALGTDAGVGEHGSNGRELALMVEGGMTPMQALVAATSTPARLLGRQDSLGTLEAGKLADVVAVQGDPLGDISILADPARIRVVAKAGAVVRQR
ncbi:MAG TPA: amidohydrolase family protein [Candidatus Dormibacteraeota bacterium]|jgi:imidazolonepropionase-like amidohydrolase|nr:amidohydrolase family protein [Candidatus Dormibacteraeota bacterium]